MKLSWRAFKTMMWLAWATVMISLWTFMRCAACLLALSCVCVACGIKYRLSICMLEADCTLLIGEPAAPVACQCGSACRSRFW